MEFARSKKLMLANYESLSYSSWQAKYACECRLVSRFVSMFLGRIPAALFGHQSPVHFLGAFPCVGPEGSGPVSLSQYYYQWLGRGLQWWLPGYCGHWHVFGHWTSERHQQHRQFGGSNGQERRGKCQNRCAG